MRKFRPKGETTGRGLSQLKQGEDWNFLILSPALFNPPPPAEKCWRFLVVVFFSHLGVLNRKLEVVEFMLGSEDFIFYLFFYIMETYRHTEMERKV